MHPNLLKRNSSNFGKRENVVGGSGSVRRWWCARPDPSCPLLMAPGLEGAFYWRKGRGWRCRVAFPCPGGFSSLSCTWAISCPLFKPYLQHCKPWQLLAFCVKHTCALEVIPCGKANFNQSWQKFHFQPFHLIPACRWWVILSVPAWMSLSLSPGLFSFWGAGFALGGCKNAWVMSWDTGADKEWSLPDSFRQQQSFICCFFFLTVLIAESKHSRNLLMIICAVNFNCWVEARRAGKLILLVFLGPTLPDTNPPSL